MNGLFTELMRLSIPSPSLSCSLNLKSKESSPTPQHKISRRYPFGQNAGSRKREMCRKATQ